jgi:hypothetical protein
MFRSPQKYDPGSGTRSESRGQKVSRSRIRNTVFKTVMWIKKETFLLGPDPTFQNNSDPANWSD